MTFWESIGRLDPGIGANSEQFDIIYYLQPRRPLDVLVNSTQNDVTIMNLLAVVIRSGKFRMVRKKPTPTPPGARNDYDDEAACDSYMNPESGFRSSGPGGSVDASYMAPFLFVSKTSLRSWGGGGGGA